MPINNLITIRKGSEAEWISSGSILASGEPGFDTTNGIFKIGDGVSTWDNLLNKAVFSELELNNQTSGSTIFNVEGTNGSLFSVVDNLDGTLMSVNNNAGLPVLEVFSDDSIVGGRFGQNDFVVSSSGNVGIGTATPSNKLEVAGGNVLLFPSDNTRQLNLYSSSYGIKASSGLEIFTGDAIRFKKGSTENVTIDTNGNVGIGTNVPSTKLDVSGIITATDGNSTNWNTAYGWGDHGSAGYQSAATALTTSTNFSGDISGTYNNIVIADDSHNHIISNIDGLQSALDLKASLSSPTLTGTPLAPTANTGTNTTQIATTAFVRNEVTALVDSAPATLDTLNELAAALGDDPNFATTVTNSLAGKSPLSHTHTHDDITDFDSAVSDLLPTISNPVDNRILTSTGTSTGINAESNATFDGTTLAVSGEITIDNLKLDGNTLSATNTDGNIIVQTNGTGAIQRDINGDARGNYAVDLQNVRSETTQVASGQYSVIVGGSHNHASGDYSAVVGGKNALALLYGERAHSTGKFFINGDSQHRQFVLRGYSTINNPISLTLNDDYLNPLYLEVPEHCSWNFSIKIIARRNADASVRTAGINFVGVLENTYNTGQNCLLLMNTKNILHLDETNWDANLYISYTNNNVPYLDIVGSNDDVECVGYCEEGVYWVAVVDVAQVIIPANQYLS